MRESAQVHFELLGPLRVVEGDGDVTPARPKQRALLALLLLRRGEVVPGAQLIEALWGEEPPGSAQTALHGHVSNLRKLLGADRIRTRPPGYMLQVSPDEVDVARFESLIADARGCDEPGERSARLRDALSLWHGEPLAELRDQPFAAGEIARLEELRLAALEDRIDADLALGRHTDLVPELEGLIAREPLRERLRAQHMLALYQSGRQADALAAYHAADRALRGELGIQPSAELRELERRILAQDPELVSGIGPPAPRAPISPPATRYASNGGISLAYQVFGSGDIDLLLVTGWVLPMELFWDDPAYVRFLDRLASYCRVIMSDKRGTGQSDRLPPGRTPTLEERTGDLAVVLDAVRSERSAIFGISEGVMLTSLFAAAHPERTRALILYGGFARGTAAPDFPFGPSFEQFERFLERVQEGWADPAQLLRFWAPSKQHDLRLRAWWARSLRFGASPTAAAQWLRMTADTDIRDVLPSIRVPTLVLHPKDDRIIASRNGRYIAEHIPNAEYVELPGEDHLWWVGDQEPLLSAIESFLAGASAPRAPERVLATVLFADPHHQAVREQVAAFGGREIESSADGVLASFDGPTRAIRCAVAIRAAAQEIRAGVHTGECELSDGALAGRAVDVCSQIGALAKPGEILVSRTVTDLVAGSELRFMHGDRALDGLDLLAVA